MLKDFLILNFWGMSLSIILPIVADYYLTLIGSKFYHQGVSDYFSFSGSYELNPLFEEDIEAMKTFSFRFLGLLLVLYFVMIALWVTCIGFFGGYSLSVALFSFFLGGIVLTRLPIISGHLENILMFRRIINQGGLHGRIVYQRWFTINIWVDRFIIYAFSLFIIFLFANSPFILGGAFFSLAMAANYYWQSKRTKNQTASTAVE